jgi:dihydrofolate synthase/folylpolyglutamate synthase
MNYAETISYLYERLPMFSRIGAQAYKKDLHNTLELCESIGNPHHRFRSIHIAGTNGKGSVSHMLASVLMACGYKTGLYTSPHLRDFRERIRINGQMVTEDFVTRFTGRMMPEIDRLEPSFFEITVAMAFEYFAEEQVDVAVIETGLGGRLDSTNVITPELSVITNIGWDHMNILGDTLPKIAFEKAGIIKARVPVVIGEYDPQTAPVFTEKAQLEQAPIIFAEAEWKSAGYRHEKGKLIVDAYRTGSDDRHSYGLDLSGIYQVKNLLTVLEAVEQLRAAGWQLPSAKVVEGLSEAGRSTGLRGRWELIRSKPRLIVDVAHNPPGMELLREQIGVTPHRQLHIVLGMVKDKDVDAVLALLPEGATYYFTRATIPRAMPEDELLERAMSFGHNGHAYPNIDEALKAALGRADEEDLILVCGSVFLAGELDPDRYRD